MIAVDWDDAEHSIMRFEFSAPWTAEELAAVSWQMFEMAEGKNRRLDIINIVHPDQGAPPENMITVVHEALRQMPRQFVMIVTVNGGVVADNMKTQFDRTLMFTEAPFILRLAATQEAARALIAQDRGLTGNLPDGNDVDSEGAGTSF